jgi:hypothetical protein
MTGFSFHSLQVTSSYFHISYFPSPSPSPFSFSFLHLILLLLCAHFLVFFLDYSPDEKNNNRILPKKEVGGFPKEWKENIKNARLMSKLVTDPTDAFYNEMAEHLLQMTCHFLKYTLLTLPLPFDCVLVPVLVLVPRSSFLIPLHLPLVFFLLIGSFPHSPIFFFVPEQEESKLVCWKMFKKVVLKSYNSQELKLSSKN